MRLKIFCVLSFLALIVAGAADQVPLPLVSPMFGDNMVLQRGKPNAIWGWAKSGDTVRVEIAGRVAKTVAVTVGHAQSCIVDGNDVHQQIDGFGASSAWQSIWTTAQGDMFFSTNNGTGRSKNGTNFSFTGIGLSLLRTYRARRDDG